MTIKIKGLTEQDLARYISKQLNYISPLPNKNTVNIIKNASASALARMEPILDAVRNFTPGLFNPFNALQHSTYLYLLSNTLWKSGIDIEICERIFMLNRAHHSIDIFYSVELPSLFFLSHGLGTVLGNVKYEERLVVFHNVTVGRVGEKRPTLGKNIILYPGAIVTGSTTLGDNCVVSAGTIVHNLNVPEGSVVYSKHGEVSYKRVETDYSSMYFR